MKQLFNVCISNHVAADICCFRKTILCKSFRECISQLGYITAPQFKSVSSGFLFLISFVSILVSDSFAGSISFKQSDILNTKHVYNDTGINNSIIAPGATPVLISDQFSFTEGPATDREGNVFFTDQPDNKIWKYDINGHLSLFMDKAGRSNGLYFDKKGNIIACADEHNQLWKISPDKKVNVVVENYDGNTFNGPNDVWVNPVNNGIYFTDPYYKRDYWAKDHPPMRKQNVYYLSNNKKTAVPVEMEIQKPNGIIGTPDGRYLFIADIGAGKIFKYKINKNGRLSEKQLFASHQTDGMTIDSEGNIYLAGKGVTVYNPKGQMIEQISIPEGWTANVCFGGKEKDILFITASKSIYTLQMNLKGVQ
ncbi:MAG: SMP-30/gluconolactonase/LRE family protein [Ginsengibacter sp.]